MIYCLLWLLTSCFAKSPIPAKSISHHVKAPARGTPALVVYTKGGLKKIIKPAVYNNTTHSFPKLPPFYHKVIKGESVYSLSRTYKVAAYDLIQTNMLTPPYTLTHGDILKIPRPKVHIVEKQQSLERIASLHKQDLHSLAKANRIKKTVKKNQPIFLTAPRIKPSYTVSKKAVHFKRPLRGKILSSFGSHKKGIRNDGINISAPKGASVHAAEEGVVVYVGNTIKSYGNLVLVKHSRGWMSAYAHLDTSLVQKGMKVKKGQTIAKVGMTGYVKVPQLHFEIRKGSMPMNPIQYLH